MDARPNTPEALLARYAELIDAGDFDGIGALFADAAITDASGALVARGRAAVSSLYQSTTRRFEDGTPKTKHITTNTIVENSDDGLTARARSYFVVLQQVQDGPIEPIAAGRYHDKLVRLDNGWQFTERQMLPEMFGDVSQHLLFDASKLANPQE